MPRRRSPWDIIGMFFGVWVGIFLVLLWVESRWGIWLTISNNGMSPLFWPLLIWGAVGPVGVAALALWGVASLIHAALSSIGSRLHARMSRMAPRPRPQAAPMLGSSERPYRFAAAMTLLIVAAIIWGPDLRLLTDATLVALAQWRENRAAQSAEQAAIEQARQVQARQFAQHEQWLHDWAWSLDQADLRGPQYGDSMRRDWWHVRAPGDHLPNEQRPLTPDERETLTRQQCGGDTECERELREGVKDIGKTYFGMPPGPR